MQNGLRDRPLVPVGTTLVKASQLFFRLTKDLAPFFFEVPRAFGAYDRLLRDLGACDSPSAEDYASSLVELKSELGDGKLNANELQSSIEICNLVANEDITHSRDSMFAPDSRGILVDTDYLVEDDCPWLTQSERLDLRLIHLTHPKLSGELCRRLKIGRLSERVDELFEDVPQIVKQLNSYVLKGGDVGEFLKQMSSSSTSSITDDMDLTVEDNQTTLKWWRV